MTFLIGPTNSLVLDGGAGFHCLYWSVAVEEVDGAARLEHTHVHRGILLALILQIPNAQ